MRIIESDIQGALTQLNSIIKERGIVVRLEKRYGYKAFDLYHRQEKGGSCIDTLKAGMTSGQAFDYIWALIKGITLYTWGAK